MFGDSFWIIIHLKKKEEPEVIIEAIRSILHKELIESLIDKY